jgi:hypothetical protein
MSDVGLYALLSLIPWLVIFLMRDTLKAWLTRWATLSMERGIEEIRSDLRTKEQLLSSKLQERQASLENLRSAVLQVAQGRHSELERRRLDAAEKVWETVLSLRIGLPLLHFMSRIRFAEALEGTENDPSARTGFKNIEKVFKFDLEKIEKLGKQQLYVTPRVMRALNAYMLPIFESKLLLVALADGLGSKMYEFGRLQNYVSLKEILPQWAEGIDKFGFAILPELVVDLEKEILVGLAQMLEGTDREENMVMQLNTLSRSLETIDPIRRFEDSIPQNFLNTSPVQRFESR